MDLIEKAIILATQAHKGQKDKAEVPYILHPLRVMSKMDTFTEQIAAVLHDILEDTDVTPEILHKEGFSNEIVDAVICLTRQDGKSYDKYINQIKNNPIALKVKIADLEQNMEISRIKELSEKDIERVQKYHRSWLMLKEDVKCKDVTIPEPGRPIFKRILSDTNIGVIPIGNDAIRETSSLVDSHYDYLRLIEGQIGPEIYEFSMTPINIRFGKTLLCDTKTDGKYVNGQKVVPKVKSDIFKSLACLDMVFVITCLRDEICTGAASYICSCAKKMGILSIVVANTSFKLEGAHKDKITAQRLKELCTCADSFMLIPNQRLLLRESPNKKDLYSNDLATADSIRALSDLILFSNFIHLPFEDVKKIFQTYKSGIAWFGRGKNSKSVEESILGAAEEALNNLSSNGADLSKAKYVIINVTSGPEAGCFFYYGIMLDHIYEKVNGAAEILHGWILDNSIKDDTCIVSIIAGGMNIE